MSTTTAAPPRKAVIDRERRQRRTDALAEVRFFLKRWHEAFSLSGSDRSRDSCMAQAREHWAKFCANTDAEERDERATEFRQSYGVDLLDLAAPPKKAVRAAKAFKIGDPVYVKDGTRKEVGRFNGTVGSNGLLVRDGHRGSSGNGSVYPLHKFRHAPAPPSKTVPQAKAKSRAERRLDSIPGGYLRKLKPRTDGPRRAKHTERAGNGKRGHRPAAAHAGEPAEEQGVHPSATDGTEVRDEAAATTAPGVAGSGTHIEGDGQLAIGSPASTTTDGDEDLSEGLATAEEQTTPFIIEALRGYPGGKGCEGTVHKLINLIPPHRVYCAPFAGGDAIVRHKRPADRNVLLDLDENVVKAWTDHGPSWIDVEHTDALTRLRTLHPLHDWFLFIDPPYLAETLSGQRGLYTHNLTYAQHEELLMLVKGLKCKLMICAKPNLLYEAALKGWHTLQYTNKGHGPQYIEQVWMNYAPPTKLHEYRYLGTDYRDRERIKKKVRRQVANLMKLPALERAALLEQLNTTTR